MIDHAVLLNTLDYDPDTGEFVWKIKTSKKVVVGKRAGGLNSAGYVQIKINNHFLYGHRLAWFYVHGQWPVAEIDHINRNPSDNRIANLRLADRFLQNQNKCVRKDSKTGVSGVRFRKDTLKWTADLKRNKKTIYLGCFQDKESAILARKNAEALYFSNHLERA